MFKQEEPNGFHDMIQEVEEEQQRRPRDHNGIIRGANEEPRKRRTTTHKIRTTHNNMRKQYH